MNSRLFLYFGFGIIFLALIFLPVKVRIVVQPEVGETELLYVGPILTFLIGIWSFPSFLLGIIENFKLKRKILLFIILILFAANVFF